MPNVKFTELAKGAIVGGRLGIVIEAGGDWQLREVANVDRAEVRHAVYEVASQNVKNRGSRSVQRRVALAADHARARCDCLPCLRKTFESPSRSYGFFSPPSPQGSYGTGAISANSQQFVAVGSPFPHSSRY